MNAMLISIAEIAKTASSVIHVRKLDSMPNLMIVQLNLLSINDRLFDRLHNFIIVFGAPYHRMIVDIFVSIYIVILIYFLHWGLLSEPNLIVMVAIKLDNTIGLLGVLRSRLWASTVHGSILVTILCRWGRFLIKPYRPGTWLVCFLIMVTSPILTIAGKITVLLQACSLRWSTFLWLEGSRVLIRMERAHFPPFLEFLMLKMFDASIFVFLGRLLLGR